MAVRRYVKWGATLSAVCFPPLAVLIGMRAYRAEKAVFFPRRMPLQVATAQSRLPGVTEVQWGSPAARGWYVPPKNGATVILTHGAGADRSQVLPEARLLSEHGFGVLLFDWPGHGESEGEVHWSEGERRALAGALDWLAARPETDARRVGVFGFSMGGYVVAQVAAVDPRPRAVVLAGTPSDVAEQSRRQFAGYGPFSRLPARWALERGGLRLDEPQPAAAVGAIAPRPVLIVAGSSDHTVPLPLGQALFAAARDPKELLVIEGADHGQYDTVARDAYRGKLVSFFGKLVD
jgi:fermentation-respiration switch protein FrsA (DUF1100 family)